jgi:hypothetical protein
VWMICELAHAALRLFFKSTDTFLRGLSAGYVAMLVAVVLSNFAVFSLSLRAVSMYVWLIGGMLAGHLIHLANNRMDTVVQPTTAGADA